jgi:hypothetical protein
LPVQENSHDEKFSIGGGCVGYEYENGKIKEVGREGIYPDLERKQVRVWGLGSWIMKDKEEL